MPPDCFASVCGADCINIITVSQYMAQDNQPLKVLALGPKRFLGKFCFTGDATQMRRTTAALQALAGCTVTRAYYGAPGEPLLLENGDEMPWNDIFTHVDVVHLFGMLHNSYKQERLALAHGPVLMSTIYWGNWMREWVAFKVDHKRVHLMLWVRYIYNRLIRKRTLFYPWCRCILPNSWAEGDAFRAVHRLSPSCGCYPIPNAIERDVNMTSLARPAYLPQGDYVVCPGVFAARKNQISLVRAMRGSGIPIVFVGKAPEGDESLYEQCREEADESFYFVGYKSSEEDEYWAIMKYARCAVLCSDCETPGIALLEAAVSGARPVVPIHGGTQEYYGIVASYLNPLSLSSIATAVKDAWCRGRLTERESLAFKRFTWKWAAEVTLRAYRDTLERWLSEQHL